MVVYEVTVHCPEVPKINGWEFIASIETVVGGENYLNFITGPKADQVKHLRNYKLTCEHCNVNRFRKHHYVVKNNKTEETKIVGSSCLKDFLGHNPKQALSVFEINKELEDLDKSFILDKSEYCWIPLKMVLQTTFAVIRNFGYKKRNYNSEDTTWKTVNEQIYLKCFKRVITNEDKKNILDIKNIDIEKTNKVLENWKNTTEHIDISTASDIDYKKYLFLQMEGEIPFMVNWVAPCVGIAYGTSKIIEKEDTKRKRDDLPGGYFGEIKKREKFELEVSGVTYVDSYYGTKTIIYGFQKDTNQKWVWFTSGKKDEWENYKNQTISVKATVKDHINNNKFGEQTVLKIVTII